MNSARNSTLIDDQLRQRLKKISHVALDMDGTIYTGDKLLPSTHPFFETLNRLQIGYSFVTNNPSKSIEDYLAKLNRMGLAPHRDQLYTSAIATIDYLKRRLPHAKRLFVLGTPSMCDEFSRAGFQLSEDSAQDKPDAVVVGFDMTLTYNRLCRAAWWISQRLPYVATNPDWVCPTELPTVLVDCGSICAMLEKATGRAPDKTLGKPDPDMIQGIVERLKISTDQIAMAGDRLYTDIEMARRSGALGVLVLTGECQLSDVEGSSTQPDVIVPSLAEFGQLLMEVHGYQSVQETHESDPIKKLIQETMIDE